MQDWDEVLGISSTKEELVRVSPLYSWRVEAGQFSVYGTVTHLICSHNVLYPHTHTHTFHFRKQTSCGRSITHSETLRAALEPSCGANAMQSSSLLRVLLPELHSRWAEMSQI